MSRSARKTEIHRRRVRRRKLTDLRRRYARAKSEGDRTKLLERVHRVAPTVSKEGFLAALQREAKKG